MEKLRKFTSKKSVKKVMSLALCMMLMLSLGVTAFAAEGDTIDYSADAVSSVTNAFSTVTSTISISNVLAMIGIALAACVGLFFFWWGIRKVIAMVTAAFKKGRVSV